MSAQDFPQSRDSVSRGNDSDDDLHSPTQTKISGWQRVSDSDPYGSTQDTSEVINLDSQSLSNPHPQPWLFRNPLGTADMAAQAKRFAEIRAAMVERGGFPAGPPPQQSSQPPFYSYPTTSYPPNGHSLTNGSYHSSPPGGIPTTAIPFPATAAPVPVYPGQFSPYQFSSQPRASRSSPVPFARIESVDVPPSAAATRSPGSPNPPENKRD